MKNLGKFLFIVLGLCLAVAIPESVKLSGNTAFYGCVLLCGVLAWFAPVKDRGGMIAGQVSQLGLRQLYENAKRNLAEAGLSHSEIGNAVLSLSEIRLEQQLNTTQNVFTFPILDNASGAAAIRPTEKRLAQQDAFFCHSIGIYIAKAVSAADTAFMLETYPNIVTFPVAGVVPAPLNTFYNGRLNININKSDIVVDFPVFDFMQIPQTQRIATATPAVASQFDPSQVALWDPTINFIGTKSSKINVTMPSNISAIDTFVYAVIKFHGILAQNVTVMS